MVRQPGWKSTANANEALAFLAKDANLLVDDFNPTGSQFDIQKKHREADDLLRGQGNRAGRNRMRPDATLRLPKPPRGMILSTGEDVPRGQSLQARLFVHEVSPGTVNVKKLTYRQRDAARGRYATAMSGFIRWLAHSYDRARGYLKEMLPHFREEASSSEQHRRTPTIVAELYLGLDLFVQYAQACGALTKEEGYKLLKRGWTALGEAAAKQVAFQTHSEPVQRFLDCSRRRWRRARPMLHRSRVENRITPKAGVGAGRENPAIRRAPASDGSMGPTCTWNQRRHTEWCRRWRERAVSPWPSAARPSTSACTRRSCWSVPTRIATASLFASPWEKKCVACSTCDPRPSERSEWTKNRPPSKKSST